MFKVRSQILGLVLLFYVAALISGNYSQDNFGNAVRLGNPLADDGHRNRSLNVWDLQAFEGKIYLAGGSTVTNSGPINVWAYNPGKQKFEREYTVEEEAIEHYRVFDDRLYIPAADPTQGDRHKFYRRDDGQWRKYTSDVVKLAHVRDLFETDREILLVGNNRQPGKMSSVGTTIASATEDGFSFTKGGIDNVLINGNIIANFNWFFAVFQYQKRIFATNSLLRDGETFPGAIAEYDHKSKIFKLNSDLLQDEFIPRRLVRQSKYGLEIIYRPWKPVEFQNHLIYPVRSYSIKPDRYRESYMNTLGFFNKSGMGNSPRTLRLPHRALGEDVLVVKDELYVLANKKRRNDNIVSVYKTDRLKRRIKWQQVVKFKSTNKARSFEYLDGRFYFGLGQDYGEAIANSGVILSYTPR